MTTETLPKPKKPHKRGNLQQFLDPSVHENIYGKRENRRSTSAPKTTTALKKSALIPISGGRFEIDHKILLDKCTEDFEDAWFFKGATQVSTRRHDSASMNIFKPKEEVIKNRNTATSQPKRIEGDELMHSMEQHLQGMSPKLINSMFDTGKTIKYNAPKEYKEELKIEEPSHQPMQTEVAELFHNATNNSTIDTFVKRKYVQLRIHQELGVNSPDIILFKECLKKNVLPPGSLDMEKSKELDFNHASDHASMGSKKQQQKLTVMASTLLGRPSTTTALTATSIIDLEENYSTLSLPEPSTVPATATTEDNGSVQSLPSLHSTDLIGIENEQIISLNLNNRSIGNERGICLSSALSYCPHLCTIRLSNNRLTDRSLSMILKAVFNISYCEELDISHNSVGDLCTECLSNYLQASHTALRKLNIQHCNIDDVNCIKLCASLHCNDTLESFNFSQNNLEKLEEFNMIQSESTSGGTAIAKLLVHNTKLKELYISGNNLRRQCMQQITDALIKNKGLELLDLSRNNISDQDGRLLGRSLHSHATLTYLDISGNAISSKGAITIAYAAQQPDCRLQYINLNENSIGKLGGVYMLRAMRTVASYSDPGHLKHARHFAQNTQTDSLMREIDTIPSRRKLTIDYKVTVLPFKDENIYDIYHPLKHYELNLSDAYDYTIARMLIDIADRHPYAQFKGLKYLQPGSHLWEYIHLTRGGLFELPIEFGLTSAQIWTEYNNDITIAIETIQAAKIAEMQSYSTKGKDTNQGRRKAFRAIIHSVDSDEETEKDPNKTEKRQDETETRERLASILTMSPSVNNNQTISKHVKHKTRSARHVISRIGQKIGFHFEEKLIYRIIDRLCLVNSEARSKFITLLEIIYQEVYEIYSLRENNSSIKYSGKNNQNEMLLPMNIIAEQVSLLGAYKDVMLNDEIPAVDRVRRFISECDLSETKTRLSLNWYLQLMMARQLESIPPTSRTYWTALNTAHAWIVPTTGLLHIELTYPLFPPTVHSYLTNNSMLALLSQVTNDNTTERSLDQIEQVLQGTANELCLTCSQAEVILLRFLKFKTHSFFNLIEKLAYQIVSPIETKRFLVRNLYFSEILTLRRKLGYVFRVLTGGVTGHYALDMRNALHRCAALRLAELNNFHQLTVLKRDINTSQARTGDCFRNASFNGVSLLLDSAWFTELPEVGKLRFDYVSPVRVPEGIPASAGTWGCAIEEYGVRDLGNDDSSLEGEDEEDDGCRDAVYNNSPTHHQQYNTNATTINSKEQFVYELIENLFSKRFEPRSRVKRKETRSNPKNILPNNKRGGPKDSGLFLSGVKVFAQAMSVVNKSVKSQRQTGYVEKFKQKTLHVPMVREIDTETMEYTSNSDHSSGDDLGLEDNDEEEESSPERSPCRSPADRAAWNTTTTAAAKRVSPMATSPYLTQESSKTTATKKKKQKRGSSSSALPLNKFKQQHLAEASDYWKDLADTCWVRCRSVYLDLLKKKVAEIMQARDRENRDINAPIHPSTYLHPEFLALRNTAVYKQAGMGAMRRRRPNTTAIISSNSMGLHALHSSASAVTWSAVTASRKYPSQVEPASSVEIEASERRFSTTSGKFNSTANSTSSMKQTRRNSLLQQQSSSMKERSNSILLSKLSTNTTTSIEEPTLTVAAVSVAEGSGAAAVAAKMAFEKFLLRLEAVAMYNTWFTVEQLSIVIQELVAHSAPVSVIVRSVAILYNCLVDRTELYPVLSRLCSDQLRNELVHRIGILNLWSPLSPAGKFELDLAAADHREICRLLCILAYDSANQRCRHEFTEVVYYKNSLMDTATVMTTRPLSTSTGRGIFSTTTTTTTNREDHLPASWTPPELWRHSDPMGPPHYGHIHFTLRTTLL